MNNTINSTDSTNAVITDFTDNAKKALKDIIDTIKVGNNQTGKQFDDFMKDRDKKDKSNRVASVASERRQRAANAAVSGKIDKSVSITQKLTDTVKDVGKKIVDIMDRILEQSLRSYDENTRNMRRQFLTTEEISTNLKRGDTVKQLLGTLGVTINSGETKNIISELVATNTDISKLSDKQIAAITMMNKTLGTDVKTALNIVKTSRDQDELINMAVIAADRTGRSGMADIINKINEPWFQRFAQQNGGTEKALSQFQNTVKKLDASLGDYGLDSSMQADLVALMAKISSGQIEGINEDEIVNILGLSRGSLSDPNALLDGIQRAIVDGNLNIMRLQQAAGVDPRIVAAIQNAQVAYANGTYTQKTINNNLRDNQTRIEQAQQGGRLGGFLDSILAEINTETGGIFSSLAANINEVFGDNMGMEEVVSGGFKIVIGLLASIAATNILKAGGGLLKDIATSLGGFIPSLSRAAKVGKIGKATEGVTKTGKVLESASNAGKAADTVSKAGKFGKVLKPLGIVGTTAAVVGGGAEIYSILSEENKSTTSKYTSEDLKKREQEALDNIKYTKATTKAIEIGASVGATALGAKIGASIGTIAGPVGTAIGAAAGVAIGAAVGTYSNANEREKNTEIAIGNVKDLKSQVENLDNLIATEGAQDESRKKELLELRAKILVELENATKHNIDTLVTNFNSYNETFATRNADAMMQISSSIEKEQQELQAIQEKAKRFTLSKTEQLKMDSLDKSLTDKRQALAGLAGGEFKIRDNETLEEAIKRIAADVRGDGWFNTSEDVELEASENRDKLNALIKEQALDRLTNGVFHESLDDLKVQDAAMIEEFVTQSKLNAGLDQKGTKELIGEVIKLARGEAEFQKWQREQSTLDSLRQQAINQINSTDLKNQTTDMVEKFIEQSDLSAGLSQKAIKNLTGEVIKFAKGEAEFQKWQREQAEQPTDINLRPNALGGVYNKFTPAAVGEDGKEAVIPLTKPDAMRKVLNKLNRNEKSTLLKAVLNKKSPLTTKLLADVLLDSFGIGDTIKIKPVQSSNLNKNNISGVLTDEDINNVINSAGISNRSTMSQYIEQSKKLINSSNNKDDILVVLLEIAKYLKNMSSSGRAVMPASRPYTPTYGI